MRISRDKLNKLAHTVADTLAEMLHGLMRAVTHVDHPFMKPGTDGAPAGVIVMTADKGLAGAFNSIRGKLS